MKTQDLFIIEDDNDTAEAMKLMFEFSGFEVKLFQSVDEFLQSNSYYQHGLVIADVRMPGTSGIQLVEYFKKNNIHMPVILISAYADIPMVVRAMKAGAKDILLKPFSSQKLMKSVTKYLAEAKENSFLHEIQGYVKYLSEKEHKIIQLILNGLLNKQIASQLHMSISTVEVYRANIMKKLKVKNLSELIKVYLNSIPDQGMLARTY